MARGEEREERGEGIEFTLRGIELAGGEAS